MAPRLPQLFLDKMKRLLGAEFPVFLASYNESRFYGLRVNSLKAAPQTWRQISPFGGEEGLEAIPWTAEGYYYGEEERPGKHVYYHAGLYYIQEPSAMVPVELLGVQPGDRVLDLCAAPGGKSTQIAAKLQGRGVLVSNDNSRERTKALAKNIEIAGVRNAVILNEEPERLAQTFAGWFDRILVDAPCSGEGMFRKDESAPAVWEKHSVERCSLMQRDILRHAAAMLAPGGTMVYSTCTFSPEENECSVARLLAEFPELEVVPVEPKYGWMPGRPEWAAEYGAPQSVPASIAADMDQTALEPLSGTVRIWPHRVKGEGHYAAVIRKRHADSVPVEGGDGSRENIGGRAETSALPGRGTDAPRGAALSEETGSRTLDTSESGRRGGSGRKRERSGPALNAGPRERGRSVGRHAGGRVVRSGGRNAEPRKGAGEEMDPIAQWLEFAADNLTSRTPLAGVPVVFGSVVYLQPPGMPLLDGLKVVRAGWLVGEAGGGGKFQPSQSLAMGLEAADAVRILTFRADEEETIRFLKGETLFPPAGRIRLASPAGSDSGDDGDNNPAETERKKGHVLICVDGFPIGWGKYDGGMLKNGLPAGWRRL